jgi:hypothetical protein
MIAAQTTDEIVFACRRGAVRDHTGNRFAELQDRRADAARSHVDEHVLPTAQPSDLEQHVIRGEIGDRQRRAVLEAHRVGHDRDLLLGTHTTSAWPPNSDM